MKNHLILQVIINLFFLSEEQAVIPKGVIHKYLFRILLQILLSSFACIIYIIYFFNV